jgi:hypothetical protein
VEVCRFEFLESLATYSYLGFVVGSASNEAYNGAHLAEEQDIIVVNIK